MVAEGNGSHGRNTKAFFCMTVIGTGYLFPISAIWAAFDYWKTLFPGSNIEFTVTCVYQVVSVITVAALSLGSSFALSPRILGGFGGQFLCLAGILGFRWLTFLPVDALYEVLIVLVCLVAVATGFLDSALLALCSQYSTEMQSYLQLGIGLGTLVSVVYRDITKLLLSDNIANATTAYFTVALLTILVCVVCYQKLMRLPISRGVDGPMQPLDDKLLDGDGLATPPPCSPRLGGWLSPGSHPDKEDDTHIESALSEPDLKMQAPDAGFLAVWRVVWKNQTAIFLNLFLTTLCYPGIITSIPCRQYFALREGEWFQTLLLTAFTFADICARMVTNRRLCLRSDNILWTVVVRAAIFPLMFLCAASPYATDALSFAVVAAFGALNGYCVSLSLIVVNEIPGLGPEQRKTCGRISACSVNSGLCVGSICAMALASFFGLGDVAQAA